MKKLFRNETHDEERALYHLDDIEVDSCSFDGPRDGESAIKECSNVVVKNSYFNLRYSLWCVTNGTMDQIEMTPLCRSAIWYSKNLLVTNSKLHGVKVFRKCENIQVKNCDIDSIEFAWASKHFLLEDSKLSSEYPFLGAENVTVKNCTFTTKYPFQQAKHVTIENVVIDAKDAFWDSEDITCKNCTLIGDFLAWYSKKLTLINCKIISSQPLCYAEDLTLVDCTMEDCDLAFEYSSVQASIKGSITSIKNPTSGKIVASSIGEVFVGGNSVLPSNAEIIDLSKSK